MNAKVVPDEAALLPVDRRQRAGTVRSSVPQGLREDRKPGWLKVRATLGDNYRDVTRLMGDLDLHTVCQEASCPNIYECWEVREATFLIGGELCTRRCAFCNIRTAKPEGYDTDEPRRVAEAVAHLQLRFAVITGVARDDLDDGGAWLFAETIRQIRQRVPDCGVEVLPSDFSHVDAGGQRTLNLDALRAVTDAGPDVFAHNVETVARLYPTVRPGFEYELSLELLRQARTWLPDDSATKSNIIVGMGETDDEVVAVMRDLREAGVSLLTIGQYLQPSSQHLRLDRYVTPETFAEFQRIGEQELGFDHVESGPFVRSSYHAGQQATDAGTWQPTGDQPGAS